MDSDSARIDDVREFTGTINADHIGMTKYKTKGDDGYRKVSSAISDILENLSKQRT